MKHTEFCDSTDKGANEDTFEVFVVSTCPLFDLGDTILEVSKAWEDWHGTKLVIKIVLPSESAASFFEGIFEEPLVKLVQDVRRDT